MDGGLAALTEPTRVLVVDLPTADPISEIGVHSGTEVAWLGSKLLVLSRTEDQTTVHLVDPYGPETLAEIRLASAVALFAAVNTHALVIGAQGAAIVTANDGHLTPYQFPARAKPTVAGTASNQFVVAIPGVIEEWDPQARVPKRRLRLPRPTTITAVGGSERVVWMVTQQEPARIDVLPLINRGQPKSHDISEPITQISGHPKSDLLACIGASGRAYAIDLDGRTRLRSLVFPGIDHVDAIALVHGRQTGVVAAQRGRPVAFTPLEVRDPHVSSIVVPTRSVVEDVPAVIDEPIEDVQPPAQRTRLESPFMNLAVPEAAPATTKQTKTAKNLAARFAAVRERREAALSESGAHVLPTDAPPISEPPSPPPPPAASGPIATVIQAAATLAKQFMPHAVPDPRPPSQPARPAQPESRSSGQPDIRPAQPESRSSGQPDIRPSTSRPDIGPSIARPDIQPASWRDGCAAWTRDQVERRERKAPPHVASIDVLAARFELPAELAPALVVLYGAHLEGHDGVAPAIVAHVLGELVDDRRWAEALGRGELAARGVVVSERSRVRLARAVQRVLDELPPETGTVVTARPQGGAAIVGIPDGVTLLGACVIVERGDNVFDIAARHAMRAGGAILVGHDDRAASLVSFEARAIGAAAMLPAHKFDGDLAAPVIYIADDDDDASRLGLPRLA